MHALSELTSNINVFVRFFESVNMLFCQMRWLEQTVRNTNFGLMFLGAIIITFCVLFMNVGDGKIGEQIGIFLGLPRGVWVVFSSWIPIALVCGLILYFFYRRFSAGRSTRGSWDSVLFGNSPNDEENAIARNDSNRPDVVYGVPIGHGIPSAPQLSKYRR